ncbi:MAG: DUF1571 domain-containing protein [Proteobacteria bacterium]|jgi:hypothetical protein|nr:DUF1571 domain-containing protein [Pseudomonadota bacterium]
MLLLLTFAFVAEAAPIDDFGLVIEEMRTAAGQIQDATYDFHRTEWVRGSMTPSETIAVKYRRPGDLYAHWIAGSGVGREILYREGSNDGRMAVKEKSWLPIINLDPEGRLATRNSRHPFPNLALTHPIKAVIEDHERVGADRERLRPEVEDLGMVDVSGEAARCFDSTMRKDLDPTFYASRVKVCFSTKTHLPLSLQNYNIEDGELRLVEDYRYENVRLNQGLTDKDFDTDNEAYGF